MLPSTRLLAARLTIRCSRDAAPMFQGSTQLKMDTPLGSQNRIKRDIMKLVEKKYQVTTSANCEDIYVVFHGPNETPYEDGTWRVAVLLPKEYPFKAPSVGFVNKIYHPNIDSSTGGVCMDVIGSNWSPMYDLLNIFDIFLPQLLRYPNPEDPMNGDAAVLLLKSPREFEDKARVYVRRFASSWSEWGMDNDSGSDMSDDEVIIEGLVPGRLGAVLCAESSV